MNDLEQFYELCNSQVMIIETDIDGNILKLNENYEKFCGYSESELIEYGFSLIRHPKIKSSFYKKMWAELHDNGQFTSLIYNRSKDKKTIVSKYHILSWKDKEGTLVGYKAISIDVTREYYQKLELNKQIKYSKSILESIPEIMMITDGKRIKLVNSSFLSFVGFKTLDEFLQKHECICELFKKEDGFLHNSEDWIEKAKIASSRNSYAEVKIDSASGEEHIFGVKAVSIEALTEMLIMFEDITQTSQERETLIEAVEHAEWELFDTQNDFISSKERFEYAINSARDGFWDVDFRTNEFYLSTQWKERLGFEPDQKISYVDYTNLIHEDCLPKQINAMMEHISFDPKLDINTQQHFDIEYKITTKSGEELIIEDSGKVLYNEDEAPYRVFGFHRDITSKVKEQKSSIQQSKLASLGEMIGNIAHQWRQPISAINGILNDLEFEIDLEGLDEVPSSRVKEVSKEITEFTSHLSKTIDDFRNFMREDMTQEKFDLHHNILNAINIISHSFNQHSIQILKEFSSEEIRINGYPRELNQVILNILNNAKDALVENAVKDPVVKIVTKIDAETIDITISDNGGGIPDNVIDKIFDPYFTTKHESIGTGIGLSMSKNIIDNRFKGLLSVHNQEEGAVFNIRLNI